MAYYLSKASHYIQQTEVVSIISTIFLFVYFQLLSFKTQFSDENQLFILTLNLRNENIKTMRKLTTVHLECNEL